MHETHRLPSSSFWHFLTGIDCSRYENICNDQPALTRLSAVFNPKPGFRFSCLLRTGDLDWSSAQTSFNEVLRAIEREGLDNDWPPL
jgi:hypothetical protein